MQAALVATAFAEQRSFLDMVSKSKKPSDADFPGLLAGMSKALMAVSEFKESKRRSKQFNHLSGVADGIPALGWVTMSPKPCPYIKDTLGSAQFYTNRVIKEFKDSDSKQVAWARSWSAVITELEKYVKQHHTTGPAWNPKGAAAVAPAAAPAPKPAAPKKAPAAAAPSGAARSGLFAELSKGGAVTSGLKKVDRSQMTHKNPALRGSSVVTAADAVKKPAAPKKVFGAPAKKKDPVFELQGKKWVCEYQVDNNSIVIDAEATNQTVYVYKCEKSTIQIKGKVSAITLDGCKKTALVFEDCVAACEIINCQSVQVQTTGNVATVSIDKTDGCQLYLSEASSGADIITAKSSEMNISVPVAGQEDMLEMAVPEQFKTTFDASAKKLVTEPTDIAG